MANPGYLFGFFGIFLLFSWFIDDEKKESVLMEELDMCGIENATFQGGEKLTYKIYYHLGPIWWPAGEVEFFVEDRGDTFFISALGRTYKNYEKIYKVYDRYYTEVEKETLSPSRFLRDIKEGEYVRYDSIEFDQKNGMIESHLGKSKETAEKSIYQLQGCVQDLLSIVYFVRNVPFESYEAVSTFPVKVFFDKDLYDLKVRFLGMDKQKKIKKLGRFDTYKIVPDMVESHVFSKGTKMNVWISADKNRLPLIVESPIIIGSVKGVLKEYEGLKYPLGKE